ncbi:MAG: nitrile hydratase accessory protein [SAR202 cluster bacterium]|nr:nitrile hydratase accessory protein [SAR202 cluster bacterium]
MSIYGKITLKIQDHKNPQLPNLDELAMIPRDDSGPVFSEPWEASAFALVVQLSSENYFTWQEWVKILVEEIKEANLSENSYIRDHYYIHWLRALERICNDKGLLSSTEITTREEDWRRAYLNTEHGKPVALEAAFNNMQSSPDHKHEL